MPHRDDFFIGSKYSIFYAYPIEGYFMSRTTPRLSTVSKGMQNAGLQSPICMKSRILARTSSMLDLPSPHSHSLFLRCREHALLPHLLLFFFPPVSLVPGDTSFVEKRVATLPKPRSMKDFCSVCIVGSNTCSQ